MAKKLNNKKVSLNEIKVGDKVVFDDGKEKLTLTITRLNLSRGEIDVRWRTRETWLLPSDFTSGFVSKK